MAFTDRSRPAREAILAAARRRFAQDGYDRATIRAIAADAGIDASMVMRYYRSKEGLFVAAVNIDLDLPEIGKIPPDQLPDLLARHFVNRWEGELADDAIMIVLRSAVTNPIAADRVRGVFTDQIVRLVQVATGHTPDSDFRAVMVSTQLLGVALTRYILRLPPVVALDHDILANTIALMLRPFLSTDTVYEVPAFSPAPWSTRDDQPGGVGKNTVCGKRGTVHFGGEATS